MGLPRSVVISSEADGLAPQARNLIHLRFARTLILNPQQLRDCGPKSRSTQKHFAYSAGGHEENAEVNASRIIPKRGLAKPKEGALKFA